MHWIFKRDHIILVVNGYKLFSVYSEKVLQAYDFMMNAIDSASEGKGTETDIIIKYIGYTLYIKMVPRNHLWVDFNRTASEEIEIDDYINNIVSIFDMLRAHRYRKL